MIELYGKGQTDFGKNGITLHPSEATVTYQNNGQYDLEVVLPVTDDLPEIDWGKIIRCTVPQQQIGDITLGTVSYWTVTAENGATLYSRVPTLKNVSYQQWNALRAVIVYAVGDKVTYLKKNYQMIALDPGSDMNYNHPPDNYPQYWEEISGTTGQAGKVVAELPVNTVIMKTGNFNNRYMEAATLDGKSGYIEISKCTDSGETETRTITGWTISRQSFEIVDIKKEDRGAEKVIRVTAQHVSYQLKRTQLGDCNLVDVNPSTAVLFVKGAMKESYPGDIETNITGITITGNYSWKNAQSAILDPSSGLMKTTGGRMIRDDFDVYLLDNSETTPAYSIMYGVNMKSVKWTGNVDNIVTRIYPTAQREDGSTLLLPEEHIDTMRTVPFVSPETLATGLKIGQEVEDTDGTKIKLDEEGVYTRMRAQAQSRFTVDHADQAQIKLELDWVHMPDTEEYKQYQALRQASPDDWVDVANGPLGIRTVIQMTGYTWDAIRHEYKSTTFGEQKQNANIASYQMQSGSVTARAIASGSIGSDALMADSVTAREIQANSVTADRIASRSIVTELLAANAVTADEIAANAVSAEKIRAGSVTADKVAAGAIAAAAIQADAVTADKIAANAVTTEKLAAGSVEASKIAANAVTTEKLAAGSVTADKIGAGSITAAKINTDDLTAIQATLQIASIANAQIASADIGYAQVKELNASSAYFGQAVIQAGLANKLYVPRLSVGYAQMIGATIGDLVVQASNGNFYGIDVDLAGNVVATQRTVTAEEIASGHTTDGRQLVMGTDILAENLDTNNLTASHALMYSITANIIDVDQLWARQAFIDALMVQDISSNTYIQSTIGDWQSQSTITQTIGGINSRITQLGYGTFFYSTTPPDPSGVVIGDVWVEPIEDNTWDDIAEYTWDELGGMTWEQVAGQYRMYVWTGDEWKLLFDNMIVSQLQTQINQNAYAITLKADQSTVDILSGDVTDFAAELEIQSQAITAAVSSVNAKTATYIRLTDPADDPDITLTEGDTWAKAAGNGTWAALESYTWNDLANLTWDELAGASVYTWNGTAWIQTANYGMTIQHQTILEQTDRQITLMAQEQVTIGDRVSTNTAQITIQADRITQEVQRATNAEEGKIAKTSQYQTADAIVSEAVRQSGVSVAAGYLAKTNDVQTVNDLIADAQNKADAAATSAKNASIAKTSSYQSAQSIVDTAVTTAATAAGNTYIAKTTSYQTADAIVQTAEAYTDNNAYKLVSGITITSAGIDISGSQYVKIASGGVFQVTSGAFGVDSGSSGYVIWSGASTAETASFRVKKNGECTVTKLMMLNEQGTETEFNLRTAGLWKLNYHVIKSYTLNGGYCTQMVLSNGTTVNFNSAALVTLSAAWSSSGASRTFTVTASNGQTVSETLTGSVQTGTSSQASFNINAFDANHKAYGAVTSSPYGGGNVYFGFQVDATSEYVAGETAGKSTGWGAAYDGSQSVRSGADIAVRIPSNSYGNFSSYNYQITVDSSWADVAHLNVMAKINGITVAQQTVRANRPS